MTYEEIEKQQCDLCRERDHNYVPAAPETKIGFAIETQGQLPINGLRHPPQADTNGWYIWCGETFSTDPDFFTPLHTRHLVDRCPDVLRLLGLPPGYRFLLDGENADVWYDPILLDV
jgi:hypothetical protein